MAETGLVEKEGLDLVGRSHVDDDLAHKVSTSLDFEGFLGVLEAVDLFLEDEGFEEVELGHFGGDVVFCDGVGVQILLEKFVASTHDALELGLAVEDSLCCVWEGWFFGGVGVGGFVVVHVADDPDGAVGFGCEKGTDHGCATGDLDGVIDTFGSRGQGADGLEPVGIRSVVDAVGRVDTEFLDEPQLFVRARNDNGSSTG